MRRGNFEGGKGLPIVRCNDSAVSCVKTAEPIEIPFGMLSGVGLWNHVSHGGTDALTARGIIGGCLAD